MRATDSPGAGAAPAEPTRRTMRILVWDVPTRVFHWLLAGSFAGAWLLSESERWRNVHVGLGYAVLALVALRIVWGFVGTKHARFANFAFRPREALDYAKSLLAGRPRHYTGHNPLGGLGIVGLLVLAVATGVTGWLNYAGVGGEDAFEELHEAFATAWLVLVAVHVAGVLVGSLAHRENLPRAMVTGYKEGAPADAITRPHAVAGLLVAGVAAAAFAWGCGAFGTPPGGAGATAGEGAAADSAVANGRAYDDDHDD
jgi:cytochrome b